MLIGNSIFLQVLGVVAGHVYYFAHFIAPQAYGWTLIKTPVLVIESFGGAPAVPPGRGALNAPQRPNAGRNWGAGNALGTR